MIPRTTAGRPSSTNSHCQPLPSEPIDIQEQPGDGGAESEAQRDRDNEAGHGAGAIAHGKPVREVDDDARKEARLGNSEEKAHQIELARCLHQCGGGREQSPGDENAREPFASAPSLDEQCAGNLERQIAEEKDADAETEDFLGEAEVMRHPQLRKPYIGPVEIGDEV